MKKEGCLVGIMYVIGSLKGDCVLINGRGESGEAQAQLKLLKPSFVVIKKVAKKIRRVSAISKNRLLWRANQQTLSYIVLLYSEMEVGKHGG